MYIYNSLYMYIYMYISFLTLCLCIAFLGIYTSHNHSRDFFHNSMDTVRAKTNSYL